MKNNFCYKFGIMCASFLMMFSSLVHASELAYTANMFVSREFLDNVRKNRINFGGRSGIVFICDKGVGFGRMAEICRRSIEEASFHAAASRVPLIIAGSYFDFKSKMRNRNMIPLEVIFLIANERPPAAIHMQLRSALSFNEAVEYSEIKSSSNRHTVSPRSGELVIWERSLICSISSDSNDLVSPISQCVEQLLNEFFADYRLANK